MIGTQMLGASMSVTHGRFGAPRSHEWHSWVLKASMSGAHGCSVLPGVMLMGARSVRKWRSWVLKAAMSGAHHGCSSERLCASAERSCSRPKARAHASASASFRAPARVRTLCAQSVHEWHSWVPPVSRSSANGCLKASMSGAPGCPGPSEPCYAFCRPGFGLR